MVTFRIVHAIVLPTMRFRFPANVLTIIKASELMRETFHYIPITFY